MPPLRFVAHLPGMGFCFSAPPCSVPRTQRASHTRSLLGTSLTALPRTMWKGMFARGLTLMKQACLRRYTPRRASRERRLQQRWRKR